MRVWTNGLLHAVRTRKGLYLFRGTQILRHFELPGADDDLLAVAPSGGHAWLGGLRRLSLEDGSVTESSLPVLDVVALDDERVAAVLGAGKGGLRLVVGKPGEAWEQEHALRGEQAIRADFPGGIWPAVERYEWSSAAEPAQGAEGEARAVRLHASPFGVAAVCRRAGLVGVLRPGAPWGWLRVPVLEQGRLDAVVTEGGVLVTLVTPREGVTAHFSLSGQLQGHTGVTLQSVGAVPLAGGRFALFDDTKQSRVRVYDMVACRDLHPRARLSLPRAPLDAAASPDGRWAVFGSDDSFSIFELGDKRLALVASLVPEDALREANARAREKQRIEQGAQYKRPEGPPALGFPVSKAPVIPWDTVIEQPLSLALSLRSTAGPGRGVAVELSGPALEQGLVEPVTVAVSGHEARPQRTASGWAVTLADVEIPHGMNFPFDPKPRAPEQTEKANALLAATHLDLNIRLNSRAIGSAMMTVAARSLTGSTAPMKWTRPVTVRAVPPDPPAEPPAEPAGELSHRPRRAGGALASAHSGGGSLASGSFTVNEIESSFLSSM